MREMMKKFLIILLICNCNTLFAQQQTNLDSLKTKFEVSFSRINISSYLDHKTENTGLIFSILLCINPNGTLKSLTLSKNTPEEFNLNTKNNLKKLDLSYFKAAIRQDSGIRELKFLIPVIYLPYEKDRSFSLTPHMTEQLASIFTFENEPIDLMKVNLLSPMILRFSSVNVN